MRLPVVVIILALSPAAMAGDRHLALTALSPLAAAPDLTIGSEATCAPPRPITTRTLSVGTALVAIGHDCGSLDEATRLWIRGERGGWFAAADLTYQHQGAHMTDAPEFSKLVDESLSTGTLADGSTAVVHRVDIERGTRCWKASSCPSGAETSTVVSVIEVCRVDTPACDRVEVTCPASGCKPVELHRGTLTVKTDQGREHVRVQ